MNFIELIDERINIEMRMAATNDGRTLTGLRNIKSEFLLASSRDTNLSWLVIARKMVKLREETAKIYKGKNQDLWLQEITEKQILDSVLPPPIAEENVVDFLNTLSIAKEMKNFKKIQNECETHFGELVDSSLIQKWIKGEIGQN